MYDFNLQFDPKFPFFRKNVCKILLFIIFITLNFSIGCISIPGMQSYSSLPEDTPTIKDISISEQIEQTPYEEMDTFVPTPTPLISTVTDWNPYEILPLPNQVNNRTSILRDGTPYHRTSLNSTYTGSANLEGYAIGKVLNITKGPFAITFTVHPKINNPLLVWAKLTVSDPWHRIIAEDGYNRGYSSEESKTMTLYREGVYYLTLEGEFATIDYTLKTGDPAPQVTITAVPEYYEGEWPEGEGPF